MYSFIIVDDESIVRATIATLIDWENLGFNLIGSFSNGKAAKDFLTDNHVDLVLTDIKMPIMDGIDLIKKINNTKNLTTIIVFSTYSEFNLVREAFQLGAFDYILKADLSKEYLKKVIEKVVREGLSCNKKRPKIERHKRVSKEDAFKELIVGTEKENAMFFSIPASLVCIEIDNFFSEALRFGDELEENLVKAIINMAMQIPRVEKKCTITSLSYSRYLLYLEDKNLKNSEIRSILNQLRRVWKTYLNISFSIGVSNIYSEPKSFYLAFDESIRNLSYKFIFGSGKDFFPDMEKIMSVKQATENMDIYKPYVDSLKSHDLLTDNQNSKLFLSKIYSMHLDDAKIMVLELIYCIANMLKDSNDDIWNVFNEASSTNYYQKIQRIDSSKGLEIWVRNFTNWIKDYLYYSIGEYRLDEMEKAKRFIQKNYDSPDINISAVAKHVGFSEKYFSTLFNQKVGTSFLSYLNRLRIDMAKQLLHQTDMRVYEVSDAVGYNSVEHFTRVFKRVTGLTPTQHKESRP